MNWEELIHKLNHIKRERDREEDQALKYQNQRQTEGYNFNKQDIYQDKQNQYNYIIPFEGQQNYSENIDYLETQYDNEDENEDEQEQEQRLDNMNNQYLIDNKYQNQNATNDVKINKLQCQFFKDFDDKENDCFSEINLNKVNQNQITQNDTSQKHIKNSDYFPSSKKPLESSNIQNQLSATQNVSSKSQINDNSATFQKKQGNNLIIDQNQLHISMFNIYTTLGTGSFGRVKLTKFKGNDKDVYALKMMKKIEIVKLKQVDHIKSEKKILSKIRHPFLVELKGTFQDECFIYMLFEFLSGGEIFSRLRKEGRFSNDISLFYISEIYLALQYLHTQNIVYRDLKPENLLIDKDGHVKIADFGFAKIMDSSRTYTLCGTPEYLAPEIIQGAKTGYGKSVDWWALGVLIFEMLSGHPPFYDTDPMGIYQKIVKSVINFPDFFSLRAKDLIRKLLNPKISSRLGCADVIHSFQNLRKNGASIKDHKWFKGVNWDKIYNKQVSSPWIPRLKASDDVSCFEKYPESSDTLENPSKEIQKLFIDF